MQNPICISTGFLYRFMNDRNEMIQKIKKFLPDGIELSFAYPHQLLSFKISEENLKYLQSLKYNSIHAPWKEIIYGKNKECGEVLKTIEELYKQINARNVVFHKSPQDDMNILKKYDFVASIENNDWRKGLNTPIQIEEILRKNKNLMFTFDFAHALTVSSDDIFVYINKFKDRLIEIHLSMLNKKLKDHYFLYKFDNPKLRKLIGNLKNVNAPIVLECVASDLNEIRLIKKEIEYIRKI